VGGRAVKGLEKGGVQAAIDCLAEAGTARAELKAA
jgi:hypothetical protein